MASYTAVLKVAVMVAAVVAAEWGGAEAAITCVGVMGQLQPCLNYVQSGGNVQPACCNSVKALNGAATTTQDRQAVCTCLKNLGTVMGTDQLQRASDLPRTCGVSTPMPITMDVDCSKVK